MSVVFDFITFVFESLENLAYVEHDGQNLTIDILLLAHCYHLRSRIRIVSAS